MDTVNKRLAAVRERMGVNKSAFAGMIGLEVSRYNKLENGNSIPAGDALVLMAEKLPTLNLTWLLTGEGSMFQDDRVLLPADPAPAPVVASAPLAPVLSSEDEKWYKEQMRQKDEQIKLLTELLRSGVDLSKLKPVGSFKLDDTLAVVDERPTMWKAA